MLGVLFMYRSNGQAIRQKGWSWRWVGADNHNGACLVIYIDIYKSLCIWKRSLEFTYCRYDLNSTVFSIFTLGRYLSLKIHPKSTTSRDIFRMTIFSDKVISISAPGVVWPSFWISCRHKSGWSVTTPSTFFRIHHCIARSEFTVHTNTFFPAFLASSRKPCPNGPIKTCWFTLYATRLGSGKNRRAARRSKQTSAMRYSGRCFVISGMNEVAQQPTTSRVCQGLLGACGTEAMVLAIWGTIATGSFKSLFC